MTKILVLFLSTSLTGISAPVGILGAPATMLLNEALSTEEICEENIGETECESIQKKNILKDADSSDPITLEGVVRDYFKDAPILAEIARCESSFRHQNKNNNVLRGVVNNADVGVMQINEYFHLEKARKLDLDIYSLEGNLEFARYLYEREGTRPWNASKKCWGNKA